MSGETKPPLQEGYMKDANGRVQALEPIDPPRVARKSLPQWEYRAPPPFQVRAPQPTCDSGLLPLAIGVIVGSELTSAAACPAPDPFSGGGGGFGGAGASGDW